MIVNDIVIMALPNFIYFWYFLTSALLHPVDSCTAMLLRPEIIIFLSFLRDVHLNSLLWSRYNPISFLCRILFPIFWRFIYKKFVVPSDFLIVVVFMGAKRTYSRYGDHNIVEFHLFWNSCTKQLLYPVFFSVARNAPVWMIMIATLSSVMNF